jgi:hypothetical protein
MSTFKEFIKNEYILNPDFEIPSLGQKSYRQIKKTISVDQSKSEIIPVVLNKKNIASIFNLIDENDLVHKLGISVLQRIKEQGDQIEGSQDVLVVYVSNEQAQDLKQLAQGFFSSNSPIKRKLGATVVSSIERGIQMATKKD